MIQRVSHGSVWVLDMDRAKAFYTDKLGFELRNDLNVGGFRWLTVGPVGQPDFELILMPVGASPMMDKATAEQLASLVAKGVLGPGVLATADCRRTYEELKARGVEFRSPPEERPYGVEAMMKDDSGNWFSLTERRPFKA